MTPVRTLTRHHCVSNCPRRARGSGSSSRHARLGSIFGVAVILVIGAGLFWQYGLSGTQLPGPNALFLLAFVGFGGYSLISFVVGATTSEVIIVDGTSLIIRKETLSFPRAKRFDLGQVKGLRSGLGPAPAGTWYPRNSRAPLKPCVAFDYGAKTYRFGSGLEEAETRWIVDEITRRYPIAEA
jgi:hypothetical protein